MKLIQTFTPDFNTRGTFAKSEKKFLTEGISPGFF